MCILLKRKTIAYALKNSNQNTGKAGNKFKFKADIPKQKLTKNKTNKRKKNKFKLNKNEHFVLTFIYFPNPEKSNIRLK